MTINAAKNRDYSKDLSRKQIVKAIANLQAANIPLANQFISLNQWNYCRQECWVSLKRLNRAVFS